MSRNARRYSFTLFNAVAVAAPDTLKDRFSLEPRIKFAIWQKERAPDTGREHIQGYFRFGQPVSLGAAKTALGDNAAHLERSNGNEQQNIEYCTKEDSRIDGPWEYGQRLANGQGTRSDISTVVEMVKSGKSDAEIATEEPTLYAKFFRGCAALRCALSTCRVRENLQVHIFWGTTAIGKSHWVHQLFPDVHTVCYPATPRGVVWWDGYIGQRAVLFDEFNEQIDLETMLRLLDKWPMRGQVKGSFVPLNYEVVFICSNQNPATWYPPAAFQDPTTYQNKIEAFRRRITSTTTGDSREEFAANVMGNEALAALL